MFTSPAFAQDAGGAGIGGFEALMPLVLIFVVFYFLLIRPQQKKMKGHKAMLAEIRRGDRVVTGGGIIGTVTKVVNDDEVMVEISKEIKVRVQRSLISTVMAKTEPLKGAKPGGAKPGEAKGDEAKGETAGPGSLLKGLLGGKGK